VGAKLALYCETVRLTDSSVMSGKLAVAPDVTAKRAGLGMLMDVPGRNVMLLYSFA
jgi:hypothetical protein